jgi:hypothetical protein
MYKNVIEYSYKLIISDDVTISGVYELSVIDEIC